MSQAQNNFRSVIVTPDGVMHESKQAAMDHLRKPAVLAAAMTLTGGKKDLANWIIANQERIEVAFESGVIRRVTKAETKQLEKALTALKEIEGNPNIRFLQENADAIKESFRWPSVTRMTPEEKLTAARNTLTAAAEGDEAVANWVIEHRDEVLEVYKAGVVKRPMSEKALAALQEYRAKQATLNK